MSSLEKQVNSRITASLMIAAALGFSAIFLFACERQTLTDTAPAVAMQTRSQVHYYKTCIEGVTYLVNETFSGNAFSEDRRSMTVQLDRESKVVPCSK